MQKIYLWRAETLKPIVFHHESWIQGNHNTLLNVQLIKLIIRMEYHKCGKITLWIMLWIVKASLSDGKHSLCERRLKKQRWRVQRSVWWAGRGYTSTWSELVLCPFSERKYLDGQQVRKETSQHINSSAWGLEGLSPTHVATLPPTPWPEAGFWQGEHTAQCNPLVDLIFYLF